MPFVRTNNLELHYLDHRGEGPPILLMHGLTANARAFDGLTAAGLSPRFRVLAVDLRGRGKSDKPATGYGMADHAADILGLLDALGLERVVLGGHSFGAWLAIYLAAHHPERVERLVGIDVAARLHARVRELIGPSLARLGRVYPSWDAYLETMRQSPPFHDWWEPAIESYFRADVARHPDGSVSPRPALDAILEAADRAEREPWLESIIPHVRQRALLLNAPGPYGPPGTPPVLPKEFALETVARLPDCRYVEVPGNHMTMLYGEGATAIVAAITDFVEQY